MGIRFLAICLSVVFLSMGQAYGADSVVGEKNLYSTSKTVESSTTTKKPRVVAGYKKGFFIQSPDGKYKLLIGGYLQLQLNANWDNGESKVGFRIRRARLAFKGNLFTPKFTFKFQFDFAKFKTELLLDAYINYDILRTPDILEVRFGQQTIPFSRQIQISSSSQEFVDRSLATKEFVNADDVDVDGDGVPDKLVKNGRDLGIQIYGKPFDKKLEYYVGVFNGHGTNTTNVNNDFLYLGRFVYNILGDVGYGYEGDWKDRPKPAFFIAGSANYNTRNVSKDKVLTFGGETGLKWHGLAVTGEFFFRNIKPGDTLLANQNDYGYYAQAGYFIIPKRFEIAGRASQIFLDGPQNDRGEFQFGMNGFLYGKYLKLQTDYSYLPTATKDGLQNNHRYRLRLQTKF